MTDATAQRIWNTALGQLQLKVTRPNYDTWLKGTEGIRLEPGALVVGVPSEFIKEWLSSRMRSLVCQTLGDILGRAMEVSFEIIGRNGHENGHTNGALALTKTGLAAQAVIASPARQQRLNPHFTFNNFVIAESNRMAAAAPLRAAASPGTAYNPPYIYTTPGLGNTPLLPPVSQHA